MHGRNQVKKLNFNLLIALSVFPITEEAIVAFILTADTLRTLFYALYKCNVDIGNIFRLMNSQMEKQI